MYGACARNCNPQLYPIALDGCQRFEPEPSNRKLCAVCKCHSNFHVLINERRLNEYEELDFFPSHFTSSNFQLKIDPSADSIPEEEEKNIELKQSPFLQLLTRSLAPPALPPKGERNRKRSSVMRVGVQENAALDIQGMLADDASQEKFNAAVQKALADPSRKEEALASGLQDMYRSLKKFHLLLQAAGNINEDLQLHNVMERILNGAKSLVECEWASIFFVNESSQTLIRFDPKNDSGEIVGGVPMSKGIVGSVARLGQCVRTTNAHADKRYDQKVDDPENVTKPGCSMLCVPVVENSNNEKVTAVIQMVNSSNPLGFTYEEEDILTFVGQLAGQTLSHATLHAQSVQFGKEQVSMLRQKSALIQVIDLMCAGVGLSSVINQIIKAAYHLVPTERVSFFMVDSVTGDLRCVISKDPELHNYRFPIGRGIVGHVARTGGLLNIENASQDARFDSTADKLSGFTTRNILTVPIIHNHKPHAVIQCVNRREVPSFTAADEALMTSLAHSASEILHKAELYEALVLEQRKTSALLRIVKANEVDNGFENLIQNICDIVNEVLECERCSLCLVDSITAEVFLEVSAATPLRVPTSAAFCTYIAQSGKGLMIPDVSTNEANKSYFLHKSNPKQVTTRNIVAWPVKDISGKSVGVFQCSNKISNRDPHSTFTEEDCKIMETIAVQIGTLLRGHMTELLLERHVNDDQTQAMLLDYGRVPKYRAAFRDGAVHLTPRLSADKTLRFRNQRPYSLPGVTIDVTKLAELASLNFCCFDYSPDQLLEYTMIMFRDLGMKEWGVDGDILRDFLLRVRGGYRNVPYHNWYHAFSTVQFVYYAMTKTQFGQQLQDIDVLSLLVAALAHDIDHPGNTNRFEQETESHLAMRYNDNSVLENHHASTLLQLLREVDILKGSKFSQPSEKKFMRTMIIKAILATDMTHHFSMVKDLAGAEAKCPSDDPKKVVEHRQFLVSAMIHSADISAQCYHWRTASAWEAKVTSEFMEQARQENVLGIEVQPHMRDLQNVTVRFKAHLGFLDYVMTPLWVNMAKMFPELSECVSNIETNREQYSRMASDDEGGRPATMSPQNTKKIFSPPTTPRNARSSSLPPPPPPTNSPPLSNPSTYQPPPPSVGAPLSVVVSSESSSRIEPKN